MGSFPFPHSSRSLDWPAYTFILREEEVTIDDIVATLEIPRTTAYSDMGTLANLGVVTRDEDQKTHTYSAVSITLTAALDGDEYTVTPALIEAFGRSQHDQDLDNAVPYADGKMSERVAAQEPDLQYAFAIAVLQMLRDVILE
jgi:hypothetical protein